MCVCVWHEWVWRACLALLPLRPVPLAETCPDTFFAVGGIKCLKCPTSGVTCRKVPICVSWPLWWAHPAHPPPPAPYHTQGVLSFKEGFWSPNLAALIQAAGASDGTATEVLNSTTLDVVAQSGSIQFHRCPPRSCITGANGTISCAAHRTGPLCAVCEVSVRGWVMPT